MRQFDDFLKAIQNEGGRALLIGGAVIDRIQGREVKDWDIEIYNLNYSQIKAILEDLHYPVNSVGKSFGVIKTVMDDIDFDLSIPRKENKIGVGHKDFEIETNPYLSPREAALRRDLTINSISIDLVSNEIIDPFNGLEDLEEGRIKATNPDTFVEDPLRVLRIMQLLPRKAKFVDAETLELCRSIVDEYKYLPKERVFEEFKKLLLKAKKPSVGMKFLRDSGWIIHFPELEALIGCEQNPEWHAEGDVWNHTMLVIDNAAAVRDNIDEKYRLAFMFAALLHDVGKPSTTTPDLTSYGHDIAGEPISRNFMHRITNQKDLTDIVAKLVRHHMAAGNLHRGNAKDAAWKRLHNNIRLDLLGWVSKCDSCGRPNRSLSDPHPVSEKCFTYFKAFGEKRIEPLIYGRDLINRGLQPSPAFGVLINKAYEIQIENNIESKELLLDLILE